jgi:hypothetical protein
MSIERVQTSYSNAHCKVCNLLFHLPKTPEPIIAPKP